MSVNLIWFDLLDLFGLDLVCLYLVLFGLLIGFVCFVWSDFWFDLVCLIWFV
jgi:hypothetical protein